MSRVGAVNRDLQHALNDGSLDYYSDGAPRYGDRSYGQMDVDEAALSDCTECGRRGLDCRQFHTSSEYRAFITCTCGYSQEL